LELRQVSQHVWVYPTDPNRALIRPSVGVVVVDDQSVLYDCGNSPLHAQAIQQAMQAHGLPPVRQIVYSHCHWDHLAGAQVWGKVEVIAHRLTADYLERIMARINQRADIVRYIQEEAPWLQVLYDGVIEAYGDWELYRAVMPTHIFDEPYWTLQVGKLCLELEHVGGNHSDDSVIMRIPQDGVILVADALYGSPTVGSKPSALSPDFALIKRIQAESWQVLVDGHIDVFTPVTFSRYLEKLRRRYAR